MRESARAAEKQSPRPAAARHHAAEAEVLGALLRELLPSCAREAESYPNRLMSGLNDSEIIASCCSESAFRQPPALALPMNWNPFALSVLRIPAFSFRRISSDVVCKITSLSRD